MLQLLIKNGICVNPSGPFRADLAISEGKVVLIGPGLDLAAQVTIDAGGHLVLPGVIDAHVHLPWPSASLDSVDDVSSGTGAAVCGGVTTILEYVVPDESGRIIPTLEAHMAQVEGRAQCDYGFHLILRRVTGDTIRDMAEAVGRGFLSFKVFTAYEGFQLSDGEILRAMGAAQELDAMICVHAEDGALIGYATEQLAAAGKTGIEFYPDAHPLSADLAGTARAILYASHTGVRLHVVHVNTAEGAQMIRWAKQKGYQITGETCPHYLMCTDDAYRSGEPAAHYFVLAPAIRTEADCSALWTALARGDLDLIATDHCPYTSAQKLQGVGDFRIVPGGAAGVETSLPLVYTYGVRNGRFPIERLVALMSTKPARIFDLYPRKGVIAIGSDADLVIYDESGRSMVEVSRLHSRTDHSLYEGMEILGRVVYTIVRGEVVAQDGEPVASRPRGRLLTRPRSG